MLLAVGTLWQVALQQPLADRIQLPRKADVQEDKYYERPKEDKEAIEEILIDDVVVQVLFHHRLSCSC